MLPLLVSVILELTITSRPAHNSMLPLVVVMAEPANKVTSRPAANRTLPLVVVMAALTLTSRPQHATRLPLVAVIGMLMFTSRAEFKVRVVGAPAAVHAPATPIGSLTLISPWPYEADPVAAWPRVGIIFEASAIGAALG